MVSIYNTQRKFEWFLNSLFQISPLFLSPLPYLLGKRVSLHLPVENSKPDFTGFKSFLSQFVVVFSTFGEGNGTPLQCSCLENPTDGGTCRLQSMGSLRVTHDWATWISLFTFMHWRRKWQPTPVFLPGESQGQGSLVGCHLWGRTESDMTEEAT